MRSLLTIVFSMSLLILGIFGLTWCINMVEFPCIRVGGDIQKDFFEKTSKLERAEYLRKNEKELQYAKVDGAFLLIQSKDISDSQGCLWIHAFSYELENKSDFLIKKAFLVSSNGNVVCKNTDLQMTISRITPNGDLKNNVLLIYDISDEWYYDGNALTLSVEMEVNGETVTLSYPVDIYSVRTHVFPT